MNIFCGLSKTTASVQSDGLSITPEFIQTFRQSSQYRSKISQSLAGSLKAQLIKCIKNSRFDPFQLEVSGKQNLRDTQHYLDCRYKKFGHIATFGYMSARTHS